MRYLLWPTIILPWMRRLLPVYFTRVVVSIAKVTAYPIAILTFGYFYRLQAGVYVSLMVVLVGC